MLTDDDLVPSPEKRRKVCFAICTLLLHTISMFSMLGESNTDLPNDRWSPQRSRVPRGCWEPGRRGESANRKTLTEADDRIDALYKSPADAGFPTLDAVRR